ncbi:hypothetical protein [Pectinatus brassicae]|uniref:Uncharacterized protein n=1 Tax=Pectinatus brassicae TaxID=862415 RepID=A0A840UEP6_9FIRM|nr:hypothetical protein [Pectinatus brassicae]MBB5335499.1 hypothetical protein [Pectinatus brassicae]
MICYKCSKEIGDNKHCPYCGHDNTIAVMSDREKNSYVGVTIEDGNNRHYRSRGKTGNGRYKKYGSLLWQLTRSNNLLSRILLTLGIAAVIAFVIFVALPFLSIAVISILVIWAVFKLLH